MKKEPTPVHDLVSFHIHNGGVSFQVIDDPKKGACLSIYGDHYYNQTVGVKLYTDNASLRELGEMLIKASKHRFNGEKTCGRAMLWKSHHPPEKKAKRPAKKTARRKADGDAD